MCAPTVAVAPQLGHMCPNCGDSATVGAHTCAPTVAVPPQLGHTMSFVCGTPQPVYCAISNKGITSA